MENKTGILIFSRSTLAECSVKKFKGNHSFFESQKKRLEALCAKTGLDVIWFGEKHQKGKNFGERFCHSIASVFSKGYDSLIIIGNDCPQLKFNHLQSSIKSLESGNASLGRCFDGGFYLLGIQKKDFKYSEFINLSWNSHKVSDELVKLLKPKVEIDFLSIFKDVDNQSDFLSLLDFSKQLYTDVILILKRILKFFNIHFQDPTLFVKEGVTGVYFNKAPPSV